MKIKLPKNQEIIVQWFDTGQQHLMYVITRDNTGIYFLYEVNGTNNITKIKTSQNPIKLDEYAYEQIKRERGKA